VTPDGGGGTIFDVVFTFPATLTSSRTLSSSRDGVGRLTRQLSRRTRGQWLVDGFRKQPVADAIFQRRHELDRVHTALYNAHPNLPACLPPCRRRQQYTLSLALLLPAVTVVIRCTHIKYSPDFLRPIITAEAFETLKPSIG